MFRVFGIATLLLALTSIASGQSARAGELYLEARQHFDAGHLDEAAALLAEALALEPHPVLAFNLGKVYERLDRPSEAAASYETYLMLSPDAEDAAEVRARIHALRPPPAEEPDPTLEPVESEPRSLPPAPTRPSLTAPILVTSVGAASGVGAGFAWLGAQRARQTYDAPSSSMVQALDAQEKAERRQRSTRALLGAGAVLAATGVVWLIVRLTRREPPPDLALHF